MSTRTSKGRSGDARGAGFTILELILVLAVIGFLVAVAMPNLMRWAYRSKRAEAHTGLAAVYRHETGYFASNARYAATFNEIGLSLDGGNQTGPSTIVGRHYTFTLQTLSQGGRARANFRGTAAGDIDPSDPMLDVVIIENQLTVID
jgi:type IV pilus assembly protein PilE